MMINKMKGKYDCGKTADKQKQQKREEKNDVKDGYEEGNRKR